MWEAQREYSEYLIDELENELYGFLDEKLIKILFRELHSMQNKWNTYEEMKSIINRCQNQITTGAENPDSANIIVKLYEVGAIGVQLPNKNEQWCYRHNMIITEYIERSKFKLHRGLWKGLSIW